MSIVTFEQLREISRRQSRKAVRDFGSLLVNSQGIRSAMSMAKYLLQSGDVIDSGPEVDRLLAKPQSLWTDEESKCIAAWQESLMILNGQVNTRWISREEAKERWPSNNTAPPACGHARIETMDCLPPVSTCMDCGATINTEPR